MKVLEINSVKNGSTGNIMKNISNVARRKGIEVYTSCAGNLYQRRLPTDHSKYHIYIGGVLENKLHKTLGTFWGCGGTYSHWGTYLFLKKLDQIKPDIIHIHNLHSNYIHIGMLFHYIKQHKIKVIWTLHDCWSFTGHCPHFSMVQCDKWKQGCYECVQYTQYPESCIDDSKKMFQKKQEWFTGVENLVIVTPSNWLKELVEISFLSEYPVKTIHNGIDLKIFSRQNSNFKRERGIEDKFLILGVAFSWGERKGLDVFIELAKRLDENYRIVLVGIGEMLGEALPSNILALPFTNSVQELVEIYSAADIFVNPTREDTFPTTHLEALACGIPVITYNTGGAPESLTDACGIVVKTNTVNELENAVYELASNKIDERKCRQQAERFAAEDRYNEYVELIQSIGTGKA